MNIRRLTFNAEFLFLALVMAPVSWGRAEIFQVEDADGKMVTFNAMNRVTVIIGSNEKAAQATRDAGKALDEFQGRTDFRCVVVVDLRESLGNWVPPVVRMRMRDDLNVEAVRITPFYRKNGNSNDPRKDVSCVPDFSGEIFQKIGWEKPTQTLRAAIFGRDGKVVKRWEDLKDYAELQKAVKELLR